MNKWSDNFSGIDDIQCIRLLHIMSIYNSVFASSLPDTYFNQAYQTHIQEHPHPHVFTWMYTPSRLLQWSHCWYRLQGIFCQTTTNLKLQYQPLPEQQPVVPLNRSRTIWTPRELRLCLCDDHMGELLSFCPAQAVHTWSWPSPAGRLASALGT